MKIIKNLPGKINYTSLLAVGIILFSLLNPYEGASQITIDQSDMPSPGDTIRKSNALNIDLYDFTETGTDYTWDYSDLIPITQTIDTFVKVTETPIAYWPFFLLSADMASPTAGSPIPQIPLKDIFTFYKKSTGSFSDLGYAANVFGIPLPFKFDNADILFKFPMNYGNVDSSQSGFEFGIPDLGYILVDKSRVNTVDGWGNLITPYGTYEVLRLKSEVHEFDSIYIDSLGFGIPINVNYTEYKWIAKSQKIPLLTATDNLFGFVVEYVDSIRDLTVDLPEKLRPQNNSLKVYPNPAKNKITTSLFLGKVDDIQYTIYGMDGKVYASINRRNAIPGQNDFQLNLNSMGLSPGRYIIKAVTSDKSYAEIFIYSPN